VLFCAAWTLAAVIAEAANEPALELVLMPEHAPFFIGGIGLYLIHRDRRDMTAWGIVAVGWLIGQHYAVERLWHAPNPDFFSYRPSYAIMAVVTLGFVAVGAIALGYLRWANWRWLTFAGALTYPFYLVHDHLGWVVVHILHQGFGLPSWATLPGTVAAMLGLAWVLHRFVETPLTPRIRRALTTAAPRPTV
jgi:peptidoglycan/LPS O-acetylase OafA/YrhL